MALNSKGALPLYRVGYTYEEDSLLRHYSIVMPAANPVEAIAAVQARMMQDGMPMHRITITSAALNILT